MLLTWNNGGVTRVIYSSTFQGASRDTFLDDRLEHLGSTTCKHHFPAVGS